MFSQINEINHRVDTILINKNKSFFFILLIQLHCNDPKINSNINHSL